MRLQTAMYLPVSPRIDERTFHDFLRDHRRGAARILHPVLELDCAKEDSNRPLHRSGLFHPTDMLWMNENTTRCVAGLLLLEVQITAVSVIFTHSSSTIEHISIAMFKRESKCRSVEVP